MANRFMSEGYIKLYLYGINAMNIVVGVLCLVLAFVSGTEGVFEEAALAKDSSTWALLLATGILLLLVGAFGVIATLLPSKLLVPLCCFLGVVIILEIAWGIAVIVSLLSYKKEKTNRLQTIFSKYNEDLSFKVHVDKMQKRDKCCGVESPAYWKGNFTKSCCQDQLVEHCKPWYEGCARKYVGPVDKYIKRVAVIIACFAWVQGFGFVCSRKLKRLREKGPKRAVAQEEQTGQPLTAIESQNT